MRFGSVRLKGVAGNGKGGNDSPADLVRGLAGGGGPQLPVLRAAAETGPDISVKRKAVAIRKSRILLSIPAFKLIPSAP